METTRLRCGPAALCLGAALLATAPARAGTPRYDRTVQVQVDVKQTDKTRRLSAAPAATQPAAPALSGDQILAVEGVVGKIRQEQVELLERLIAETPDTAASAAEKAELYFQLADLHGKQQRYWRLQATRLQLAHEAKPAAAAAASAKRELLAAVKVFQQLADNPAYVVYAKMDRALFYYGYTLQSGHYLAEARAVYQRLLKEYPSSTFVPEALIAFADYYFEDGDLANAAAFYTKVLQFPKAQVYDYAAYMMGWVDFNQQRFDDALEAFFKVAQATQGDPKQQTLNQAAKKDFVRAYAAVGKAQTAYKYFQKLDPGYAFQMLQILGDLYLDQGQAEKAIYTFRELIGIDGTHPNVCLWQYDVAHAMLTAGTNAQKVDEIEQLVQLYGALKARKALPAAVASECHDNAAAMAGELARWFHNEASKTLAPETLGYADRLYRVYLANFRDADDFGETQYYDAELLWRRAQTEPAARLQTQRWQEAAEAFTAVVQTQKVDAKTLQVAAYAAVLGWKNALDVDPRPKAPAIDDALPDAVPAPRPIPAAEQQMLAAFDLYVRYVKDPRDPELVRMKFSKADVYRRHDHLAEAVPLFEDILTHHRDAEAAEYAANLLLDSLNRLQRYPELLRWVKTLAADPAFLADKPDLAQRLDTLERQRLRKDAEHLEQVAKASGDFGAYVACGQAYVAIFNRDPAGAKGDELLYDAGTCFEAGKSLGAARLMFQNLRDAFPRSPLAAKAIARLGALEARVAFYDQASAMYEQYAKLYAGEADARAVMSDAVFYRKGIGDDAKAIADTAYFIKTFGAKHPADAASAAWGLTAIYEKQGDRDRVIASLRAYLRQYGAAGPADRVVVAHAKLGQLLWDQACPVKLVNGSCIKLTRERAVATRRAQHRASARTHCGETAFELTVVPRDPAKVRDAMKALGQAIAALDQLGGQPGGDDKAARYWYAQARFDQADRDYEAYLAMTFPAGLDFNPATPSIAARAHAHLDAWLQGKTAAGAKARAGFEALVFDVKDPSTAIEAAARIGQIAQNFSDQLFSAEIPTNVRTGPYAQDASDAYCDALTEVAEPLEAKSLQAFGACLAVSTKLGWFSDWSKLCERELGQLRPREYPTAFERHAAPDDVGVISDVEPADLTLD